MRRGFCDKGSVGICYRSVVGGDIVVKDEIRVKEIDNPNVKFPGKNGEVPGGV